MQIGIVWFAIQNFLKALQDSLDAMPKGLSFLAEVIYLMNNIGMYLFTGNRPRSITDGAVAPQNTGAVK